MNKTLNAQRTTKRDGIETAHNVPSDKHTPGPRTVEDSSIRASWSNGEEVQIGAMFSTSWTGVHPETLVKNKRMRVETEANARLIAAAPELLEALCAMLRWTGALPPSQSLDLPDFTEAEATSKAIAAIAKAEGK